jgi:hypothetical protein
MKIDSRITQILTDHIPDQRQPQGQQNTMGKGNTDSPQECCAPSRFWQ